MSSNGRAGSSPAPGTMIKINKEDFIKICNNSLTMAEASRKLKMHFNTFKKYALLFGCYNTNQSGKNHIRKIMEIKSILKKF